MKAERTDSAIKAMLERETALYVQRNPKSAALASEASKHWLRGVPMHWMVDWDLPFPLFIETAKGVTVQDVDGNTYVDFCLGDTGAMFGHSPEPLAKALAKAGASGLTTMLPSSDAAEVGELLQDRFGLPVWQVTATASDANRAIIRWSRAVTGRKKILIFNHCYHGCVDDTFVQAKNGQVHMVEGLVGEVHDLTKHVKVIEFNDFSALKAALEDGDVACVLAEPVMTNVGMVLPHAGFLEALREECTKTQTLLVFDETHTLTSSPGGYARMVRIKPDALVMGKPMAGGVPAGLYGISQDFNEKIKTYLITRGEGRSGIGTTLSGSRIQLALIKCVLKEFLTDEVFDSCIRLAQKLESGIFELINKHALNWHVARVGARVEFIGIFKPPDNGSEAARAIHQPIDVAVHRFMLNRGVIITPFHNMLLVCPSTTDEHINKFISTLDECLTELK